ncbi:hypothetical protein L9F63_008442, partial [Diploptera punctata]
MVQNLLKFVPLLALTLVSAAEDGGPYEFQFNVPGIQHRNEKKDDRGIVTGEFGYITADGIYHVRHYATDELGNFKIVNSSNHYVGFPDKGKIVMEDEPSISLPGQPVQNILLHISRDLASNAMDTTRIQKMYKDEHIYTIQTQGNIIDVLDEFFF